MSAVKVFYDTNVLLYLVSGDSVKADRAEELVAAGGHISVQVLNEFAAVATRKYGMSWNDVSEVLATIREVCPVAPLSIETHDRARAIATRYGYRFYDATIMASALIADCTLLYSEDMQSGQRIDKQLTVKNPFKP
jgi:predicted nucleic acid-binding protein